jgi:hypothetical protein
MFNKNLGRLKRTLKEKCTDCHVPMQLRVRIERGMNIEYKFCRICGNEVLVKKDAIPNLLKEGEFV